MACLAVKALQIWQSLHEVRVSACCEMPQAVLDSGGATATFKLHIYKLAEMCKSCYGTQLDSKRGWWQVVVGLFQQGLRADLPPASSKQGRWLCITGALMSLQACNP